jgi:beta-glucanase (GH16 family)
VVILLGCLVGRPGAAFAGWQLAWSDEFSGTNVDSTKWSFDTGNGQGGWGNGELEYYTTRATNVYVSNGVLHIVARKESYNGFSYTSAKMKTLGHFSTLYGRFEFRVKLPQGTGYWPALWLMPVNSTYGGWAASGEVDIMENKGRLPTQVMGTLHYGGSYPANVHTGQAYTLPGGDSVTNFHVYAMEWTTNSFSWYVDNTLYQTQTSWWSSGGGYPAPFDIPFYIIMNLAVGGQFDGPPNGSTAFPGDMRVDYVRVYNWFTPSAPVLALRVPFTDAPGSTTSPSDTSGGGVNVTTQMTDGTGAPADYHGAAGSGVAGVNNGSRALDFSSNGAIQPGIPGPLAGATNAALGFGTVTNFAVSLWYKQNALMSNGATDGPRLFVLGGGTPSDTGATNSVGLKFQTASQAYFQMGNITIPFPLDSQTINWAFFAAVYDGASVSIYKGSDAAISTLVTNVMVSAAVNFGSSGALYIGNRQDGQRSFDGLINDFRFYTGAGDVTFVENIRLLAARPPWGLTATGGNGQVGLSWGTALAATSYNVKRATTCGGPYATLAAGRQVTNTVFSDLTASNGATYYYVISSVNPAGEGAISAEAGATPCTTPAGPVAGNNGPVCAGSTLSLTALAVPGAAYSWTGPNGFNSSEQNPSIADATTDAAGAYSVTAIVGTCVSATATTTATVNAPPTAPVAANNGPIWTGMTVNLTASAVAGASYSWTGPNGFASTDQNPSITNATTDASGLYTVTATVGTCSAAAATTIVTIHQPPALSMQASGDSLVLNWSSGTLQSATNVPGPWYDVVGAASPYTNPFVGPQQFFRLR